MNELWNKFLLEMQKPISEANLVFAIPIWIASLLLGVVCDYFLFSWLLF